MTTIDTLPKSLLVRAPMMDDLRAVSELVKVCDIAECGEPEITQDDLHSAWTGQSFNLATDAWVVSEFDGRVIAYADVEAREHIRIYNFVQIHPEYRNQGIGTYLHRLTDVRAHEHIPLARPDARVTLNSWIYSTNEAARQLLVQEGLEHVRSNWRMEIEMDRAPREPEWAQGITLRTFEPALDRAVFEMIDEAFADHWGHIPGNFSEWRHWTIERESFDPTLWFLAFDGDEIAGGSLCYNESDNLGWVGQLAVRRPWRRKGVGMALLLHSFGEFYRRDRHKVGLGVDSQNLTGATRLYERAGMHVARQYDSYQKELRAGVELSTQSITL